MYRSLHTRPSMNIDDEFFEPDDAAVLRVGAPTPHRRPSPMPVQDIRIWSASRALAALERMLTARPAAARQDDAS